VSQFKFSSSLGAFKALFFIFYWQKPCSFKTNKTATLPANLAGGFSALPYKVGETYSIVGVADEMQT